MKLLDVRSLFVRLKRSRWTKVVLLAALPVGLYLAARERASWRPRTLRAYEGGIFQLVISSDGKTLATAHQVGEGQPRCRVSIWNVRQQSLLNKIGWDGDAVESLCLSPDGVLLAAASRRRDKEWVLSIRLWDVKTGKLRRTLTFDEPVDEIGMTYLAFWPRYPLLTFVSSFGVRQWSAHTGKILLNRRNPQRYDLDGAAFSPDGETLAIKKWNGRVELQNVQTGLALRTLQGNANVSTLSFSVDGKTLAGGGWPSVGDAVLWDARRGKLKWEIGHLGGAIGVLAFMPDGSTVAYGADKNKIQLRDVRDGSLLRTLSGHISDVYSVAFSPDGATLASGSADGTVKLWRIR